MNRIEIKADGPCEVLLNGSPMLSVSGTNLEPDHITITLTEREAELVHCLTGRQSDIHTLEIYNAITTILGESIREYFDGGYARRADGFQPTGAYAHAERIERPYDGLYGTSGIRLTMDRDVAVTLRHLLDCVKPKKELAEVIHKLREHVVVGAVVSGIPQRFTGTIKWRKRRLTTDELQSGKTYKLRDNNYSNPSCYEWEEA